MTEADQKRCNSLLATLAFAGQSVARELRNELESVHGVAVTLDRVSADLRRLADLGAVRFDPASGVAQITLEGREHVQRLRELF